MSTSPERGAQWTFLTNHARVLLWIADDPEIRLRDVAAGIGITERAVQLIVADLEAAGYLTRTRVGRRNHYTVDPTVALRHPSEADHPVGDLLAAFLHREDTSDAEPVEAEPVTR
ncbi:helix-turn-helix transcriptional regulator [Streptomyces rubiginosohelvolus]|uniref:helix-turn-helix transcriptional regulator n=1 Tax=Streptomyces rubiginosohelvolus TaxID=67362 RepID=UPI0035E14BB2